MTSVTNSSGLNYQNGINPLGRKVRALEADVDMLKRELTALKGGAPVSTANASQSASSSLIAEIDALKRELATIKLLGPIKGEKGDPGPPGPAGPPGPMTYIAMPQTSGLPVMTPTTTPVN
jgi:hypothetical protein